MNQKHIFCLILLFFIASVDLCIIQNLEQNYGTGFGSGFGYEIKQEDAQLKDPHAIETLRAFELPQKGYPKIQALIGKGKEIVPEMAGAVLARMFCPSAKKLEIEQWREREKKAESARYDAYAGIIGQLLMDAVYFPVPEALNDTDATVSYENSWQFERNYGGISGHEGCDIMADIQQRGYYPVISASDGVVEKMGWLPKGGYRIGIRSPNGVYYYYAHLAEYEEGIAQGMEIAAGQLLGYMGDTGYSEVEGTVGKFPVHLHFGMYLNDAQGNEVSYNPYYLLRLLENRRLKYMF